MSLVAQHVSVPGATMGMSVETILEELRPLGNEGYKRTMMRHGSREPIFGVKIEELKKIQRRIRTDYQLALDLYATGNSDAMYLAGLIADDAKMTEADLEQWVEKAYCPLHSECTVAWVAAGGPHARALALRWIDSEREIAYFTDVDHLFQRSRPVISLMSTTDFNDVDHP